METRVLATIFDEQLATLSYCRCFLLKDTHPTRLAVLGHDPEQTEIPLAERMLQAVSWLPLRDLEDDPQVSQVIAYLRS